MLPDFELCCSKFRDYGLELNEDMYSQFDTYAEYLIEYNKFVNLTAITDPNEILIKHFIDSVIIDKYCDISLNSRVIDVGTGAGFPSVPLKIYRPDINLTLLDSLNKRITFLQNLCEKLNINADFIHGRAEDISKLPEYREKYDIACARAVANMSLLSEYCIPFTAVGGHFIAMKGPNENIDSGNTAIRILGGEITDIEEYELEGENRRIIRVKKISQTPTKYPRNSSQIKKKTL